MPTYQFEDTRNGEIHSEFMTISKKDAYLRERPFLRQVFTTLNIIDPVTAGRTKTDNEFNSLLKDIKKRTGGDGINTR